MLGNSCLPRDKPPVQPLANGARTKANRTLRAIDFFTKSTLRTRFASICSRSFWKPVADTYVILKLKEFSCRGVYNSFVFHF